MYQGLRNASFSQNFAHVLNGRYHTRCKDILMGNAQNMLQLKLLPDFLYEFSLNN